MFGFELHDQALCTLALQPEVSARRAAAADDRELALLGIGARFVFSHVDERPNNDMRAVIGYELGGHRFESTGEEEIQEQRLDKVVGMVAQRDFRGPDFLRDSVQDSAAKARAQ